MKKTGYATVLFILLAVACFGFGGQPPKEGEGMTNSKDPKVAIETSKGKIVIEVYSDQVKATSENFLAYVDGGFYDGTIFHRVIPGFMIQGGGFDKGLVEKLTRPPVKNEACALLTNDRGTVAMARTNDINSATSQFFINTVNNGFLNHQNETSQGFGYCVFGKVVEGMDVVDAISHVQTHSVGSYDDVPVEDIVIISAKRVN